MLSDEKENILIKYIRQMKSAEIQFIYLTGILVL